MKINRVRLCIMALTIVLSMTLLNSYGDIGVAKAETVSKQEITCNLGRNPKTLDPALCVDRTGFNVLANSFVGLCELDNNEKVIRGDAESWDISSDGLTYTFHLRKGLKWSNGDELKASDYEYAWKRVLNPELACEYSFQLFYIKGAEAYNTGKGSADDVGIKAINDTTLVVTLESPTSYFLEMLAQSYYFPVNQKVVESNREWASNAKSLVSNGPFKATEYNNDKVVLEKNDNYYDKDKIKLGKLTMKFTTDVISTWSSYKSGQFDIVDTVPKSNIQGALKDGSAKRFPSAATYFLSINVSDKAKEVDPDAARVLSNPKLRKALSLAIDRKILVENVAKGGQIPANGFVPLGIIGPDGKEYNEKNKYFGEKTDKEEAKKLLAEAGYSEGKGLPVLEILYDPQSDNGDIMQAIQDMWRKIGVKADLQMIQEWKAFLKTKVERKYEIVRDGWNGDYEDPMTFLGMYMSTSAQNNCGYSNSKYDELINMAKKELNVSKRYDLLHQAEDILMDDMPVIPLYYYTRIIGIKDYVKGINVSAKGNIYFKNVYVESK